MSTCYRIRHASSYNYAAPVVTSFHRLHLLPRQVAGQSVTSAWLEVVGGGGDELIVHRNDHFGNVFSRFDVLRPYSELSVVSWSEVVVDRVPPGFFANSELGIGTRKRAARCCRISIRFAQYSTARRISGLCAAVFRARAAVTRSGFGLHAAYF